MHDLSLKMAALVAQNHQRVRAAWEAVEALF
jgi:hypothetical protein